MNRLSLFFVVIIIVAVLIQGTLIFRDALRKKIPFPWIWGIIGLLNIPSSAIIYLIFRKIYLNKRRK